MPLAILVPEFCTYIPCMFKTLMIIKTILFQSFKQHGKMDDSTVDLILSEIGQMCPSYPIRKMYGQLREKKDDDLIEEPEGT